MIARARFLILVTLIAGLLLAACGALPGGDGASTGAEGDPLASGPLQPPQDDTDGPPARGAAITSDAAAACLSAEEGELIRRINEYRGTRNLPPIAASKSLTLVAQQHAWDSNNNSDAWPAPPAGKTCNMHSWSGNVNPALQQGTWSAVCFTGPPDWDGVEGSWNKPRELAGYPSDGVENSHWASNGASAAGALENWKNSPGHNAVITEQDGWGPFLALGVGISGNYAHMWVGRTADPAGEALLCSGGSVNTPPTDVPPTATVEPTAVPPTATVEPTDVPPTATAEPTAVPPTATTEPTDVPPTATVEPTDVPPTATVEPTDAPPTATVEPTDVPPTAEPTAEPTTESPAGGQILSANGEVAPGGSTNHVFDVVDGGRYTILITPAADFDAAPSYSCETLLGSRSGTFDLNFEGEPESTSFDINGNGQCTVTVAGYEDSSGTYAILVTSP